MEGGEGAVSDCFSSSSSCEDERFRLSAWLWTRARNSFVRPRSTVREKGWMREERVDDGREEEVDMGEEEEEEEEEEEGERVGWRRRRHLGERMAQSGERWR